MERVCFGTVLVGRNVLMREGLARILSTHFRILASAACVDDLVVTSLPKDESFLLIIDVGDDFDAAIKQVSCFKKQNLTAHIALLADQHRLSKMLSAFHAGANAYFFNVPTCEIFIKSLELVMLGVTILPSAFLALIFNHQNRSENGSQNSDEEAHGNRHQHDHDDDAEDGNDDDDDEDNRNEGAGVAGREPGQNAQARPKTNITQLLSPRQKTIVRCLLDGNSNKTIAHRIAIAEATVKVHVKTILRKIRVHNRTQAAIWALRHGPFIPANGELSSTTAKLSVQHGPTTDLAQVPSGGRKDESALSSALKLEAANRVALPSVDRLALKRINRKND
jgi:two-component system nitrate/nitrite response regulator NarL